MDASEIIRDLTAKGVQLAPTDHGTISITPRSRLTDADRDLLRNHKADVLAELHNMNIMNLMNIDSGHLPPARIVHIPEATFTDAYASEKRLAIQAEDDLPPAPATVTCGSCVRFQPGTTRMGIGVCLATTNGLPPKEQRGYLAAYPMAPRRCPEYAGSQS